MMRVVGAGRGVLPTWATLAAESSRRRKERTQSDLRIGLIVAPYFLAPANDNSRLAANCLANAFLAQEALIFNGIIFIIVPFAHAFQDKILILFLSASNSFKMGPASMIFGVTFTR